MLTLSLPALPAGVAVLLAQATEGIPLRVVVQARGDDGAIMFVSHDAGSLNAIENSVALNGFAMDMFERETFYLAGGQTLSAIASTTGVTCSIAVSEYVEASSLETAPSAPKPEAFVPLPDLRPEVVVKPALMLVPKVEDGALTAEAVPAKGGK